MQKFKEWTRCLFSKEYAKTTWLRIDSHTEDRLITIMDIGIVVLFILGILLIKTGIDRRTYYDHRRTSQQHVNAYPNLMEKF